MQFLHVTQLSALLAALPQALNGATGLRVVPSSLLAVLFSLSLPPLSLFFQGGILLFACSDPPVNLNSA